MEAMLLNLEREREREAEIERKRIARDNRRDKE